MLLIQNGLVCTMETNEEIHVDLLIPLLSVLLWHREVRMRLVFRILKRLENSRRREFWLR